MLRPRFAETILYAEEMGRVAGIEMAKAMKKPKPTVPPSPPMMWVETLPAGTIDKEVILGIKARALNVRTDRDIVVKLDVRTEYGAKRWPPIAVPASESPLNLVLPEGQWIERMFITASAGATIKATASVEPISIDFGRAKLEGTAVASFSPVQSYWYWAAQIEQPALSQSSWAAGVNGGIYVVPENKRLVIDLVTLSTDVKGAVQQVDLSEYKADGTLYRFGGAFFDCVVPLKMRVPLAAGSQLWLRTYNWDIDDRILWVVINGWVEWL